MPTRAGTAVLLTGAVWVAVGRVVGALELYLLGLSGLLLVVGAVVWVNVVSPQIELMRAVRPDRVHVGDECWVDLRLTNLGGRRSPVLDVADEVTTTAGADVLVAPLRRGDSGGVRYRVNVERRGEMWVGPLTITWQDPFGFARRRFTFRERRRVLVYPTLHRLIGGPRARGVGATPSPIRPDALGRSGDDIYALRGYVAGDDLRRIHWPSSARHDDLIVRQAHHPTTSRSIVIVDDRRSPLGAHGLDLATSVAGSVLLAAHQRGDEIRLMTASGSDTGFGTSTDHLLALLERLALLTPNESQGFDAALDQFGHEGVRAAIVVVAGLDAAAGNLLRGAPTVSAGLLRGDSVTWVRLHRSAYEIGDDTSTSPLPADSVPGVPGNGPLVIDVEMPGSFPDLWTAAGAGPAAPPNRRTAAGATGSLR